MEKETCETCINFVLEVLKEEKEYKVFEHLGSQIEMVMLDLNLLKMFFWGLASLDESEHDLLIRFAVKNMMQTLMQIVVELAVNHSDMSTTQNLLFLDAMKNMPAELRQMVAGCSYDKMINLDVVICDIGKKIDEKLKPEARPVCICLLLRCSNYICTSCPPTQKKFYEYIQDTAFLATFICMNSNAILNSNLDAPVSKQLIRFIQSEMVKYITFVNLDEVKKLRQLISRARTCFSHISSLTYLCWSDGEYWDMSSVVRAVLYCNLHRKIHVPASQLLISSVVQPTVIPQLLSIHLDFLLRDFVLPTKDCLQEALIFMLSFIMDPPDLDSKDKERIWEKLYSTFNKFPSLIYSIRSGEMEEEICNANISDFLIKVDRIKGKVIELFMMNPYSSQLTAPHTNPIGFLNNLVVNLGGILERGVDLIPYVKHLCKLLYIELKALQQSIMELLQDDRYNDMNDLLWKEMTNMIYNVDYSTKLCFRGSLFILWYGMVAFPDAIDHTKVIRIQIKELVGGDKLYKQKKLHIHEQMDGAAMLRPIGKAFESERAIVGFIEDEKKIIDKLLRGPKSLTIVSISGSGGQGKTTLAKRIYDDQKVRYGFQSLIWIYVSKDCPVKKLLVQILSCDTESGGAKLGMEDLILKVWRSLKGKRYLIVLDDIWDVDAWEQLKRSFPDDKTMSRILFTTRNHDLASKATKPESFFSHPLPLFSDEQSWELIKERVFGSNHCDEELVGIGKKIASRCKGLPLAVVLIAGVLGKMEQNMDLWSTVLVNLKAHLIEEGCGNVLELSYRYLQDHLKSCFLHFATFPRGANVWVKELKLLWVVEGFAVCDDSAKKYLRDLVSLGLVNVSKRGTMDGIKECVVHDLLYDLCLEKVKEEKFMHFTEESNIDYNTHSSSGLQKYGHHRVCIGKIDPSSKSIPIVIKRELLSSPLHTFQWLTNNSVSKHFALQLLGSSKNLTVLKLNLRVDVFPVVILSCIYLRHLELYFEGKIRAIPPTIATLWKLRTFICTEMRHPIGRLICTLTTPSSMWDMESLRYVDAHMRAGEFEGFDLENSSKSNVRRLGKLLFDEDAAKRIGFLRKFSNLRKLKCICKNLDALLLSMVGSLLPQLESLSIRQVFGAPETIDWNFPEKMGNLTKLNLLETYIPWNVLSEFGKQLPNLRVLKLFSNACEGTSWKLEDGDFSNLICLKIWQSDIEEIDVSTCEDPLPCLEHLELICTSIMEIPPAIGEISTLKTIYVDGCSPELKASTLEILEAQRGYGIDDLQVLP